VVSATFACTGFSCFVVGHENAPLREKACGSNSSVLMLAAPLSSPLNQMLLGYRLRDHRKSPHGTS
jgi:hypothetical protein